MEYIKLVDGIPEITSISAMKRENPDVSFPADPEEKLLLSYGLLPLTIDPRPETKSSETAKIGKPEQVDGAWVMQWTVIDLVEDSEILMAEDSEILL